MVRFLFRALQDVFPTLSGIYLNEGVHAGVPHSISQLEVRGCITTGSGSKDLVDNQLIFGFILPQFTELQQMQRLPRHGQIRLRFMFSLKNLKTLTRRYG